MSTNFGSKDGILIRTMTVEDYKQISGILYNDAPLISSFGENTKHMIEQFGEQNFYNFHIRYVEQGNCLVAVDENDGGRIVGHVLGGCKVPSDLEVNRAICSGLEPGTLKTIVTFIAESEIKSNVFELFGVSKMLYSQITNVDASMRGKGIGSRLAAALMELGRSQGIPLMVASCESFYSARQKEALGMECVYSQAYADYKDENGEVVLKPAAPHTHLRIMAMKL